MGQNQNPTGANAAIQNPGHLAAFRDPEVLAIAEEALLRVLAASPIQWEWSLSCKFHRLKRKADDALTRGTNMHLRAINRH